MNLICEFNWKLNWNFNWEFNWEFNWKLNWEFKREFNWKLNWEFNCKFNLKFNWEFNLENLTGNWTGSLTGNWTGSLTGNFTGNWTGSLNGNLSRNQLGDLTWNKPGNLSENWVKGSVGSSLKISLTALELNNYARNKNFSWCIFILIKNLVIWEKGVFVKKEKGYRLIPNWIWFITTTEESITHINSWILLTLIIYFN